METQEQLTIKDNGDVILRLPEGKKYKRFRCIGNISDGVFYTHRNSQNNQVYHYSNSFNFNYRLISDFGDLFDVVCVNFEGQDYWTSRERILNSGKYVNYKNNLLDRQIGVSIYSFKNSRAEAVREMKGIVEQREIKLRFEKEFRAAKMKPTAEPEFQFA